MSGLLALLDDVAGIAKIAAASVDDISAHAAKAGSKAAGVVIDDAAVTPKYVHGFEAARELPIIWRIARVSVFNKLVILLPAALLMAAFAPWLVPPLLVLGGSYLCFEGAEKILHVLLPHDAHSGGPDGSHDVGDPAHLEEQKVKVEENLAVTLDEREFTVGELETLRAEILAMDPSIIEVENKISVEQDAAARTKLETELADLNAKYNEMVQQEQVKLAKSQTLERYIEKGKTWVDSLQNQAATQMVLINKLQTDTQQRVVLYDALSKSLKTAQQQDVAHRINEIGVQTDQEAQTAMAAIGTATNQRMADMLEAHEDHMVFARKVLEQRAKADERFARRFQSIVEKHDKNLYGG